MAELKNHLKEKYLNHVDPKDRLPVVAALNMEKKLQTAHLKCPKCWLLLRNCMCSKIDKIKLNQNVFVYMHYKEYHRASNTGKVIALAHDNTKIYIFGQQDKEFIQNFNEENLHRTLILFPCESAITTTEFVKQLREKEGETIDPLSIPLNIVILDGTWAQAGMMQRSLTQQLMRVKLTPTSESLFWLRSQTQKDRISTIESLALFYREMGDNASSEKLIDRLKITVRVVNEYSNRPIKDAPKRKHHRPPISFDKPTNESESSEEEDNTKEPITDEKI